MLCRAAKGGQSGPREGRGICVQFADHISELYGLRCILADIDAGRNYWRDGDSVVTAGLDWITGEGWEAFFGRFEEMEFNSAHEFRQRHQLMVLSGLSDLIAKRRGY